jgi:PAS domain-containing protein
MTLDAMPVIDYTQCFTGAPAPMLVIAATAPRFTIIAVNDAYLEATLRTREDLIDQALFDAMPDNPDDEQASGVSNLRASIERVIASGQADRMPLQKYDIPHPRGGFDELVGADQCPHARRQRAGGGGHSSRYRCD